MSILSVVGKKTPIKVQVRPRPKRPPLTTLDHRIVYCPYGAASEAIHDCKSGEILLSGPAGTGKSVALLMKLFILAEAVPRVRLLIIRKTRASLTESGLVTWEEQVLPAGSPICRGARRRNRSSYVFPNGSEIVICGMDKPTKVYSTFYDVIYVQEAIELLEDEWEKLTTRLRNYRLPFQQIIADTNPDSPTHWLKRRCDVGLTRLCESRHEDNPVLYTRDRQLTVDGADYIGRLDRLTGVRYQRLRLGRWVQAEGVVYEDYDPQKHLVDRFDVPSNWPRYCAIDYGFTNPFVCLWIACDNDGRAFVYRQIYMTKRIVEDHCKQILSITKAERIVDFVADHDAEDRATMERHGIITSLANKDTKIGREEVAIRLRAAGDGRPRLFIMRDSLVERDESLVDAKLPYSIEQEFDCYVFPKGQTGVNCKEEPVDKDNHAMDALRYGMMRLRDGAAMSSTKVEDSDPIDVAGFRSW